MIQEEDEYTKPRQMQISPSFNHDSNFRTPGDMRGSDDDIGRTGQDFRLQKADFESKSASSETASDGRQPSQYRQTPGLKKLKLAAPVDIEVSSDSGMSEKDYR